MEKMVRDHYEPKEKPKNLNMTLLNAGGGNSKKLQFT